MVEFRIETDRLILREWRDADAPGLGAICRDPRVMEFLGPLQDDEEAAAAIGRQRAHQASSGFCYWALERKADGQLLGFCGLQPEPEAVPVIGGLPDIGWRLAYDAWGHGYAREAATAALAWGFATLDEDAIWAITVPGNRRSWGLMERLGMQRRHDLDFAHPLLDRDDPLSPHITYWITRSEWDRR